MWVSAGAASAVAAKLALAKGPAVLAYTDTGSEHTDNARFLDDLEGWFGQEILRLHSDRYKDVDDVIDRARYINGPAGARCTTELKRMVRFAFQRPTDRQVFGFTADKRELKRALHAEQGNPGVDWWWPLIEAGLMKADCLAMVERAGLTLPITYSQGFDHANCLGCVKATSPTYWNLTRKFYPEVYARRAKQEREIGHSIMSVEITPGTRQKTPVWLDELPPDAGKGAKMPDIDCSIMCVMAEAEYA